MTSMVSIDASSITNFAQAMSQAPAEMNSELVTTTNALLATGTGIAQGNAPVKEGVLRASIGIIDAAGGGGDISGSYGTSIVYAKQREYGGTIRARNARYLVFMWHGALVFAKEVHQKGTRYMGRSAETMKGLTRPAYEAAVARVMAGLGG